MRVWCLVAGMLLPLGSAFAAPTLSADIIRDLKATQGQLEQSQSGQSDYHGVAEHAHSQARRLAGGNTSDRWARALYLQLSANALVRAGDASGAAERLAEARGIRGVRRMDSAQVDHWQRQEIQLRHRLGDSQQARELLSDWLSRHTDSTAERWLMARLLADNAQWEAAAQQVELALKKGPEPSEAQGAFAASVLQRAGDQDGALELISTRLSTAGGNAAEWRRAAGLAQQLGDTERAAAIWEAGWQLGMLAGSSDLEQRIRLHLAAGTPARAAELLEQAQASGELPSNLARQRLLAESWLAARDRDQALAAWQALAEESQQADDWLRLGQLAHGWGRWDQARHALERARTLGANGADDWLANLPPGNLMVSGES
ncbi:hypothetical protein [Halomonas halocynthiae]|uniref:hypothetical protein n=1 Tax=Halomonas halocynthiae TaxID=176290 RepID=UPI0005598259|nr:hypothetical protein [Halomonas halocynthiae]